jgi:hypothetical protein
MFHLNADAAGSMHANDWPCKLEPVQYQAAPSVQPLYLASCILTTMTAACLCVLLCCCLQLLDSLNRQELSMVMWALSKLRLEPGDLWLDEYFDATEAQLTRFTLRVSLLLGTSDCPIAAYTMSHNLVTNQDCCHQQGWTSYSTTHHRLYAPHAQVVSGCKHGQAFFECCSHTHKAFFIFSL